MALVFTTADLAALKSALVSGALEVQIGDRKIKYRSQAELISVIQMVQNYLDGVSTSVDDNPNMIKAGYSRGSTSDDE